MNAESAAPAVTLEIRDHVAVVRIDRPEARNAISPAIAQQLDAIVQQTEADEAVRAVVLTSGGDDIFCAGADLRELAAGRGALLSTERGGFAGFVRAPRRKPWIAAVQGLALGGGCEIALSCDLVVAADSAAFGLPEVQRGIIAAAGGVHRLPRAIPRNIALELILTGDRLPARRAAELGLVNRLVPHAQVLDEALALAARIAANAPLAVQESLRIAREADDRGDAELMDEGIGTIRRLMQSHDAQEGTRAFVEKRAPEWKAR